jgi:hypothetical protein
MRIQSRDLALLGVLLAGSLSACNFPLLKEKGDATPTPLSDTDILGTAVAQTLSVLQGQVQSMEATPIPTATVLPTATSAVSAMSQSQSLPQAYTQACYAASVVSKSIDDYAEMDQDEEFTQTWTIVNAGTCNWESDTELVYVDGTQMDGDSSEDIDTEVAPGETMTASVALTAPSSDGTYSGQWALVDSDGTTIVDLWVTIVVGDGDADDDFYVDSVTFSSAETYSGACPYTYTYKAYITTEGDGDVVYYFKYSDGSTSSSKTLEFEDGETQTVSGSWSLSSSGSYWVKVCIDEPNNQTFGSAKLTLSCASPTKTPTSAPTSTPTSEPTAEENSGGTESDTDTTG